MKRFFRSLKLYQKMMISPLAVILFLLLSGIVSYRGPGSI